MAAVRLVVLELGLAGLVGGLVGLLAGVLSSTLAFQSVRPDRLSWLLVAVGATGLLAHPNSRGDALSVLTLAGVLGLLLLIAACDLRERAVYPAIVYPGLALAGLVAPLLGTSHADAILGAVVTGILFSGFFALARLRYGRGAFGDGDVPVAILVGVVAGAARLPAAFAFISAAGAVAAVAVLLRTGSRRASFPYAPVLCLAAFAATLA